MNYICHTLPILYHTESGAIAWQGAIFFTRPTNQASTLCSAHQPGGVRNGSSKLDTARYPHGRSIPWGEYPPAQSIHILSVLRYLPYQPFPSYRIEIYPISRRRREWAGRIGYRMIPPCGVSYKWDSGQSGPIVSLSVLPYPTCHPSSRIRIYTAQAEYLTEWVPAGWVAK